MDTTQVACQRCELTPASKPAVHRCLVCGLWVCDDCTVYDTVHELHGLCVACDREAREYAGKGGKRER